MQVDYAYEQNRITRELVREEANLEKSVASIARKVPNWQNWKAKVVLKDPEKKKAFLDEYMPPKLRKGAGKKEAEARFIGDFCETCTTSLSALRMPQILHEDAQFDPSGDVPLV